MTSSAACASPRTVESDSVIIRIISKVQPAVVIKADNDSICPGTNVNFIATATNAGSLPSYQWKINGLNTGTNSTAYTNATLKNGDVVSCILNSDPSFTCVTNPVAVSNSITMHVSNLVNATAKITASRNNICKGTDVTFSVASQNAGISPTYEWQVNGAATGSNTLTYSTSQLNNGDKIYCLVTPGTNGCSSLPVFSDTITMIVNDPPGIAIKPGDTTIPAGSSLQLQADVTGNISSYEWTPAGSLVNPFSLSPFTNSILNDISFSLVAVSTEGCTSQEKVSIKVSTALFMPSAFTPNNDGLNDVFRIPPGVSLKLSNFSIYDKWGNMVFKTTDKFKGWDGMINNEQANPGVYVYILKGSGDEGLVSLKGTIVLIR